MQVKSVTRRLYTIQRKSMKKRKKKSRPSILRKRF
jgi:hypothetical protein